MHIRLVKLIGRFTAACCLVAVAGAAFAQQPAFQKPLRIIVPYAAGGVLDSLMRRMGSEISTSIGQPVIIDNKPGGLTSIGMQACSSAPPDGTTVCFTLEDSTVYNALLYRKLTYDPNALLPVIDVASARAMIVARGNAPFNNFKELVAYAKANPGKVNFGTWGPASSPDLYRQWFNRTFGIDLAAIPYRGIASGTMPAIMAGEIDVTLVTIGQVMPQVQGGKLKPVAIVGTKRFAGLPNVSSLGDELADPGIISSWGLYAPLGTPTAIVNRLNAEFTKAAAAPAVRELFETNTIDFVGGPAADFATHLREMKENGQRIFRMLEIKPLDMPG
jgi:tripartite-type tricarboxylate transporter receptor subunit TctC